MSNDNIATGDLVVLAESVSEAEGSALVVDDGRGDGATSGLERRGQRGMVSAEWAVGIVAAIAIAGVLLAVVTSGQVKQALLTFLLWVIKSFVSVVS